MQPPKHTKPCTSDKNGVAFVTTPKRFYRRGSLKRESPDSGRESMDQLLQARTGESAEQNEVWIRCVGSFTAKASSLVKRRSCSRC